VLELGRFTASKRNPREVQMLCLHPEVLLGMRQPVRAVESGERHESRVLDIGGE